MNPKVIFSLAVTLFVWASAFAGIRAALQDYSPFSLALGGGDINPLGKTSSDEPA